MEGCFVRLVRVPEESADGGTATVERTHWITEATRQAIKELIAGEGPLDCHCQRCDFQSTRKRVLIHCAQHFCRYYCACQFGRSSRDSVYDHQLSKHRTVEHGGPKGLIYCVDRELYPAFCEAMGWQDPADFSTHQPTKTGQLPSVARTPSTL